MNEAYRSRALPGPFPTIGAAIAAAAHAARQGEAVTIVLRPKTRDARSASLIEVSLTSPT